VVVGFPDTEMPFPMAHTIEDVKRRRRLLAGWLAVVMVVALAGVAPAGAADPPADTEGIEEPPQAAAFGFPEPDMTPSTGRSAGPTPTAPAVTGAAAVTRDRTCWGPS
jgi:hypothetical protein